MSDVTPARIGLLFDYLDDQGGFDDDILDALRLVFDEYTENPRCATSVSAQFAGVRDLSSGGGDRPAAA